MEAQGAAETIEALEKRVFSRVVTGAGGLVTRVGPKLAAQGVSFKALGKIAGIAGGTAVSVAMFVLDGNAADNLTPFQESMTVQEWNVYWRWRNGEDVFVNAGEPNWLSQDAK